MPCGSPKCIEDAKKAKANQQNAVQVSKIIKTTIADADVLIDSEGRRYIRKR